MAYPRLYGYALACMGLIFFWVMAVACGGTSPTNTSSDGISTSSNFGEGDPGTVTGGGSGGGGNNGNGGGGGENNGGTSPGPTNFPPGFSTHTLEHQGLTRKYKVYMPSNYSPQGQDSFPVVLAFHGRGDAVIRDMINITKLDEKAESAGYILVLPEGTPIANTLFPPPGTANDEATWNLGLYVDCSGVPSGGDCYTLSASDDTGFVRLLIDELADELRIDRKRVFATGLSDGGAFAYKLACELSDYIAAIAPVAGFIWLPGLPNLECTPLEGYPIQSISFIGTLDASIFGNWDNYISNVAVDNPQPFCTDTDPEVSEALPNIANDGTDAVREVFTACDADSHVERIKINWGGMAWHDANADMSAYIDDAISRTPGCDIFCEIAIQVAFRNSLDISANDMMWEFFQAHPRP